MLFKTAPGPFGFDAAQLRQGCFRDGLLNMTLLALRFSRYANGVAMQHGKVPAMFPEFTIDTITNGVHAPTWMSEPMQQMLDEHLLHGGATISCCVRRSTCRSRRF